MFQPYSALIPAAGNSGRMGSDKTLLPLGNGLTFATNLVNSFAHFGCNPLILVVNEQFDSALLKAENLVTVVNRHLGKGRSWSVHLGLKQVPEGFACFIQNIDNPFLTPGVLKTLVESLTPDGYVVPVYHGRGGHPILLGGKVVDYLRKQKELNDFRQRLQHFRRVEVPYPDERILLNINTPDDYKEFIRWNR